jgi:phage N-6-adenine-methyltransferase
MSSVHFMSKKQDWATPRPFFDRLNDEFHFTLDVAASHENALLPRYFTDVDDGLVRSWQGERCWMNPPYGQAIGKWVKKAHDEARAGAFVVCLVPARTDTRWWHDYVMNAREVRLVKGRLSFGDGTGSAPFPSAVVVFEPGTFMPDFSAIER